MRLGLPSRIVRFGLPFAAATFKGLILIDSVDMLWDHAATVLNATGYLAVTSLLQRAV